MVYVIALLILLVIPFYNYYKVNVIQLQNDAYSKEKGYVQIYLIYWSLFLLIIFSTSFNELYRFQLSVYIPELFSVLSLLLAAYIILTTVLPLILMPYNETLRQVVFNNYNEKLYPITPKQQVMFVFVAITVGICEEFIYRGFLFQFINDSFGFTPLWTCIIISVIFGASHFMQGISGIMNSFIFGIIMVYLYLTSGSLILPIIIHILYDLKQILIARMMSKNAS